MGPVLGSQTWAQLATFAVVSWAMVGMGYGGTFAEQFTAFSSDGYHVQVAADGQEANIVLDQVAGKNLERRDTLNISALHVAISTA